MYCNTAYSLPYISVQTHEDSIKSSKYEHLIPKNVRWKHTGTVSCQTCISDYYPGDCSWPHHEWGDIEENGSCDQCCECIGHHYSEAEIMVFCEDDSCHLPTTLHFDFGGRPEYASAEGNGGWIDECVEEELGRLLTDGKYLCDLCCHRPRDSTEKGTDEEEEYSSNILEKGICECGHTVEIRRAKEHHTQYHCDNCGREIFDSVGSSEDAISSSYDSRGGPETDEVSEYGAMISALEDKFSHEEDEHEEDYSWRDEDGQEEDW